MRDNYANKSNTELAKALKRTVDSIAHKARELHLSKPPHKGKWSDQDLAYLKENYATKLNPELSKKLKRDIRSISNKAFSLGLHKNLQKEERENKRYTRQWCTIGSERLTTNGYLRRKVSDTGNFNRDWRKVHVIIWEETHGPVPDGFCLAFKDGNKQNVELQNLELISKKEMMKRNTINQYPEEVREVIKIANQLKQAIKDKENGK